MVQLRDAAGHRNPHRRAAKMKSQACDGGSHLIRSDHGLRERHAGQQHRELFAPDSRNEVGGAKRRREACRDALQDAVAGAMSVAVVDAFEAVNVP